MEAKMESLSHPSQACATDSPHQPNFNTLSWGPTLMSGRPPLSVPSGIIWHPGRL